MIIVSLNKDLKTVIGCFHKEYQNKEKDHYQLHIWSLSWDLCLHGTKKRV